MNMKPHEGQLKINYCNEAFFCGVCVSVAVFVLIIGYNYICRYCGITNKYNIVKFLAMRDYIKSFHIMVLNEVD